jgi:predicted  nucleic acid-binding Zn-ribbon protein
MAKAAVASAIEFEAIDRLEQKLKQLVAVLDRTRAENARANDDLVKTRGDLARAKDENGRLRGELDAARARVTEGEGASAELMALKSEREQIRGRVDEMLKQLDAIAL